MLNQNYKHSQCIGNICTYIYICVCVCVRARARVCIAWPPLKKISCSVTVTIYDNEKN